MKDEMVMVIRKLVQQHAYDTIKMHESIAQRAGLSGTDHKYLGFLIVKGSMTAGELATLSGLTTGAVTGLIDRFEKRKLVKRQFDELDRRKVIIVPNIRNIMALLEPLFKEFAKDSEEMIASYPAKELKVIESFLRRSIEIMEQVPPVNKRLDKKSKK